MALRFIADFPQQSDKAGCYVDMALLLIEKKDFDGAVKATRLISHDTTNHTSIFVDVLMRIHAAQWRAGDRVAANHLPDESMQLADRERKKPATARFIVAGMYRSIAARLVEAGNVDAARAMVAKIDAMEKAEKDPQQKESLISHLAMAQTLIGETTEALRTAARLPPGNERDSAFGGIARQQMQQGDREAALRTANAISNDALRVAAVQRIGNELAISLLGVAKALLDQAESKAPAFPDPIR